MQTNNTSLLRISIHLKWIDESLILVDLPKNTSAFAKEKVTPAHPFQCTTVRDADRSAKTSAAVISSIERAEGKPGNEK